MAVQSSRCHGGWMKKYKAGSPIGPRLARFTWKDLRERGHRLEGGVLKTRVHELIG